MQLVIGNKNYSSWSMRPWLLLRHHGIAFDEIRVWLDTDGYQQVIAQYSPSMRVPVLIDAGVTVWDSLAICEYISERYLAGAGYPAAVMERARCRSYCSEMHSGFTSIRTQMPMNCRSRRRVQITAEVAGEVRRVDQIWSELRRLHGDSGAYLFGEFGIADCMYAPMAMRFLTYGVSLSVAAQDYVSALLANPAVQEWRAAAEAETEVIPGNEPGDAISL